MRDRILRAELAELRSISKRLELERSQHRARMPGLIVVPPEPDTSRLAVPPPEPETSRWDWFKKILGRGE
jgi:hypothetical protein